ncbi:MAG: hypothetical protein EoVTN8_1659 [Fluviibacter phosphoraccumulans EoVTN8]
MMGCYQRLWLFLASWVAVLSLSGCQSYWDADPSLGSSVNSAIRAQVANPNAPQTKQSPKQGMDGVAAKKSVDNYQKSFDDKATTSGMPSLVNINNASTGINP